MDYKLLNNNSSFASQVTNANTFYEIHDNFSLNGQTVVIPDNCVLRFNGGSLSNGVLASDGLKIEAPLSKIFDGVTFQGNFLNGMTFQIEWFVSNYETFFNTNSIKDASVELNQALNSGIQKVHFNNDRYFPISSTVQINGNLDISGERIPVAAGHNWFLRVPCIYSTQVTCLFRYDYIASHGDASRSKPRLSLEGVNFCCAAQPGTFNDRAIVEINNQSNTTLWGLYIDINIVSSNGTSSITDNYSYTGLKIRAVSASIAFVDIHGSVSSVYRAYDIAKTSEASSDFINDVKIWSDTTCVRGGTFKGGFPVKNFGSHQMVAGFSDAGSGKGYFESEMFENYGYVWDAGMNNGNLQNTKWNCQYIATPIEGKAGFHHDRTQTIHRDAELATPTDIFYPNLLADGALKYKNIGIDVSTSVKSYNKANPTVEDPTGVAILSFRRYMFPRHLSRWDGSRLYNSQHSDVGYSYNTAQNNYIYQYDVDITIRKNHHELGQYQDLPPMYISPSKNPAYENDVWQNAFTITVKYYYSENTLPVKTVVLSHTDFNNYLYGEYIRIDSLFLDNNHNDAVTVVEFRQRLEQAGIITRPMFFIPNYHSSDIVMAGTDNDMVQMDALDAGEMFYHTANGQLWWNGSKWVERDGASAGVRRSGTFAQKPAGSDIYVGFRYFCISGATVHGDNMSNIEIYYTGSGWVDALGRLAS